MTLSPEMAKTLNQRQLWFLGILQQGESAGIAEIIETWKVSMRAARYDLGEMMDAGLIRFTGSKKTGRYELL